MTAIYQIGAILMSKDHFILSIIFSRVEFVLSESLFTLYSLILIIAPKNVVIFLIDNT